MIELKRIIAVERKRILNLKILLLFLLVIVFVSVYSSYTSVKRYDIPDQTGVAVKWSDNLTHGRVNSIEKWLDKDYMTWMAEKKSHIYIDETNVETLVSMNYEGKAVQDLSEEEKESFYTKRLSNIREIFDNNSKITYTEEEKEQFMEKAEQLSLLPMGYAEGWKILNEDMAKFVPLLLILIAIVLLPFFGDEPKTKMKELYRSTKYGKKKLDEARIIAAFLSGIILYLLGIILYFVIKIVPFGMEGGNQFIQSNATTFFSVYNITYLQQFLLNVLIGFVALIFVISFTLFISILLEGIMTGAVVLIFFWILLLVFEQMTRYPVNHWFANFMPLRMTAFTHYYTENDIYRVFGDSITCMNWVLLVSFLLAVAILILAIVSSNVKRKRVFVKND